MNTSRTKTYVVAEIGSNHGGDFQEAVRLLHLAAKSGADAVKFQVYRAERLVASNLPVYAHAGAPAKPQATQLERFKRLEFAPDQWRRLQEEALANGVDFLASVFDAESADLVEPWVRSYKVASGDITNLPLLHHLRKKAKPLVLSTGASTLEEIQTVLSEIGSQDLTLLHCVASYPAPVDQLSLNAIVAMRERFGVPVGYSDHSIGILACIGAVALGASFIEKHFTADATIPTGDHRLSAEPADFEKMVQAIRQLEQMMGRQEKIVQPCEEKLRPLIRRAFAATHRIAKGETIKEEDLILLRPQGDGIGGEAWEKILGCKTTKEIEKGSFLSWDDLTP